MIKKLLLTFGTSIAILLINIVGGILAARLLGPQGKGQLTAVTLWPSVLAAVGNLGIANAIVFYVGNSGEESIKKIWAGTIALGLIQTGLLIALGFFLLPILMSQYSSEYIWIARTFLLFVPLNIFTQYWISIFQGRMKIVPYNVSRFLVVSCYLVSIIILSSLKIVSVLTCTIVLLLSNVVVLIFELLWLTKLGWVGHHIDFVLIRKMLGYGLKSHLGSISSLINLRMDQMVMAIFLAPNMLGLYVVAVTISSGVGLIANAIATITFPAISVQNMAGEKKRALTRSLRLSFWCSLFVGLTMLLSMDFIINVLYGQGFSQAIPAARVLIVATVVSGLNMILASGLKGYGLPGVSSMGEFISLLFTGIFLWLLLPRWGIIGGAVTSLISYSCNFVILYSYAWFRLSINPKEAFLPQVEDYLYIQSLLSGFGQSKIPLFRR